MKKHLIVGAILTGAWAATLFLIPNGAAADLQMPGAHSGQRWWRHSRAAKRMLT